MIMAMVSETSSNSSSFYITLAFLLLFTSVLGTLARGVVMNSADARAKKLCVEATLVSKKINVEKHATEVNVHIRSHDHTKYLVTFALMSGTKMEFAVTDKQYDALVEKDKGSLTFQGKRYISFEKDDLFHSKYF